MNLYKMHDEPESIHGHDKSDKEIPDIFWEKYKNNPAELKKREDAIAKSAKFAYYYVYYILKGRFPKGEPAIAKSAKFACYYAQGVLKGPFPLGESAIAKNADYACNYAHFVLKHRFPEGEPAITKDKNWANRYNNEFGTTL